MSELELFNKLDNVVQAGNVPTMDSREIAELTGKNHSDVCRDVRTMLENLKMGESTFASSYLTSQNKYVTCYALPYRETMILISGYSVDLRAKIVDRWLELEGKRTPRTFAEALQLAADQAKKIEQQQAAISEMKPKAEFFDAVTDSTDAIEMKDAAKVLNTGIGRNELMKLLREKKVLMDNNTPYQAYIDRGYFRVIETKNTDQYGTTRIFLQTVVYQKGLEFIRKVVEKYAVI